LHDPSARAELKRHDHQQSMQNGSLLRQCARPGCGKPEEARGDFKSCSACKSASYCGAECQRAHWKGAHKAECAQLKAAASAAGGPACDD
jgi:hypothetical protein